MTFLIFSNVTELAEGHRQIDWWPYTGQLLKGTGFQVKHRERKERTIFGIFCFVYKQESSLTATHRSVDISRVFAFRSHERQCLALPTLNSYFCAWAQLRLQIHRLFKAEARAICKVLCSQLLYSKMCHMKAHLVQLQEDCIGLKQSLTAQKILHSRLAFPYIPLYSHCQIMSLL